MFAFSYRAIFGHDFEQKCDALSVPSGSVTERDDISERKTPPKSTGDLCRSGHLPRLQTDARGRVLACSQLNFPDKSDGREDNGRRP